MKVQEFRKAKCSQKRVAEFWNATNSLNEVLWLRYLQNIDSYSTLESAFSSTALFKVKYEILVKMIASLADLVVLQLLHTTHSYRKADCLKNTISIGNTLA